MMMYNPDTKEVAKPSELLNSIKAIMSVLQSIENYGMYHLISISFRIKKFQSKWLSPSGVFSKKMCWLD